MKKAWQYWGLALTVATLTGCASSERMGRLSGGVAGEYSVPRSHRLRSERFQAKSNVFSSAARSGRYEVAGLNDTLVNIWPFFFRSRDYTSILWPFIDIDRYGMAIRPFYNQEGDEYSILFPLCAWNPVNGDGWLLNTGWGKDFFLFLPLAYHSFDPQNGTFWYTPLVIHSWKNATSDSMFQRNENKRFTEILLGYRGRETRKDKGEWDFLFSYDGENNYPDEVKAELAYRLGKIGRQAPKDPAALNELRKEIYEGLPEGESSYYGFFPLFHHFQSPEKSRFNLIGPLLEVKNSSGQNKVSVLGPVLGCYATNAMRPVTNRYGSGNREFLSFVLLSRFASYSTYAETPEVQAWRKMAGLSHKMPLDRYRTEIEAELKKIDPALTLPATVVDRRTLELFLQDCGAGRTYPLEYRYSGGFLPLFCYEFGRQNSWWVAPALLTGAERNEKCGNFWSVPLLTGYNYRADGSTFWSVPLLTLASTSPEKDRTAVLWPIAWYSKTVREKRIGKSIHTADTKWAGKYNLVEMTDQYAALGLYYHGKHVFYIAKPGVDAKVLEQARALFLSLEQRKRILESDIRHIRERTKRNQAWQTKTQIEYYRRQIEFEEIKLEQEQYDKHEELWKKSVAELEEHCGKLGFPWNPAALDSRELVEQEVDKLFDFGAEVRHWEDFGSGLFFRRELYYNGDFKWNLCWILAGGEKKGIVEDTRVLHFLYRYRQDGQRSEEFIFPFISIRKEGENKRVSFLWRVFERKVEEGKVSGHVFFIPCGN